MLKNTLIVERGIGTRIVDDAELLQRQRKRQVNNLRVLVNKSGFRDAFPEPDMASLGEDMCGQRSCQYHDERQMQQHDGHSFVEPLLHDVGERGYCEYGPQGGKPPSTIDMLAYEVRATIFLYDSGKPYTRDDKRV